MSEPERTRSLVARTRTNDHGFFQLVGLPPGSYALELEADGLAPRAIGPIDLASDHETRLFDLELLPFLTVELEVVPALDPDERPWIASLASTVYGKVSATLDEDGRVELSNLAPGDYEVAIDSSRGDPTFSEKRQIESSGTLRIELDLVRIEGHITLDGEPLEADLAIGAGSGDRVSLRSDFEGNYTGWLRTPKTPYLWVYVTALDGALRRLTRPRAPTPVDGVLPLRIELEDLWLGGQVVWDDGLPVAEAQVVISRDEGDDYVLVVTETSEQGRFALRGLPSGELEVQASAPASPEGEGPSSSSVPIEATASRSPSGSDLRLLIERGDSILGLLLDGSARPVPAAGLHVLSFGALPLETDTESALDGSFRARVAPGARRASVIVFAPSQLLWAACLELPREEGELWTIQLPSGPPGKLKLRDVSPPSVDEPRRFPRYVLMTSDGGLLSWQHQLNWNGMVGAPLKWDEEETLIELPGLAPGFYAPFVAELPFHALAQQICALGARPNLPWQPVAVGQELTLELDLPNPSELGGTFPFPAF